jgi:hypothetical protein
LAHRANAGSAHLERGTICLIPAPPPAGMTIYFGVPGISLIAHSWGSIVSGRATT